MATGKLNTSEDNVLPIIDKLHRAGDIRAMENSVLAGYHTIFMWEHNRIVDELRAQYPQMNSEELFQAARHFVIGLFQKIVMKEFLPILLGDYYHTIIGPYTSYKSSINPNIPIEFSTAAFRIGHTLLTNRFNMMDTFGQIY